MVLPTANGDDEGAESAERPPPPAPAPATCFRCRTQYFINDEKKGLAKEQVILNGMVAVEPGRDRDILDESPVLSAVEMAIKSGDMTILEHALDAAEHAGVDVLKETNCRGDTALATAILKSNLPAIHALLKRNANPHSVSNTGASALHKAVHDPKVLKYLLDNTDVESTVDNTGLAPLHAAVRANNPESVKLLIRKFRNPLDKIKPQENSGLRDKSNNLQVKSKLWGYTPLHYATYTASYEAAEVILDEYKELTSELRVMDVIEAVDDQGDTPLHTAARHNSRRVAMLLLREGAVLSTTNKNGVTVIELISNNFHDASMFFDQVFDKFIGKPPNNDNLDAFKIHVDYRVLTNVNGKHDMSHMNVLEKLVDCGQSKALIHPLIESLLYLKWVQFLPLFYAMITVYAMYLASVNIFLISVFRNEDLENSSGSGTMNTLNASSSFLAAAADGSGLHDGLYWLLIALIYISISILLMQECFFICLKRLRYFASVESWVKLLGLVLCAGAPLAALAPGAWPRHAACAALLLAWLQAMFLVSRVPRYGFYILMFGKVALDILKILVTAIFVVVSFSFCFMIQYRSAPPFDGPFAAFVKTLVMMSSEFDYEDLFGDDHDKQLRDTSTFVRILFVIFVIFVAIVLMNFMIGLAVSDISELKQTGNIRRLEKQVELLSTLDSLVYDGVFSEWFKSTFGGKRHPMSMSTETRHQSTWQVTYAVTAGKKKITSSFKIRSRTLYNAIVETAMKYYERANKNNSTTDNLCICKIDALHENIVDRSLATDENDEKSQQKGNTFIWLRDEIMKQNERMKSMVNELEMTSHENNEIKRSIEDMNTKINCLLQRQTQ